MTKAVQKALAQAMSLRAEERLALAESLLETTISSDPEYIAEWEAEIDRRIGEIERGEVRGVPWETVRKRLMENRNDG